MSMKSFDEGTGAIRLKLYSGMFLPTSAFGSSSLSLSLSLFLAKIGKRGRSKGKGRSVNEKKKVAKMFPLFLRCLC